jgi:hypothetical protein
MNSPLPAPPTLGTIKERLNIIFPEGTANRNYVVRDTAVKTIAAALYLNAIEGAGSYFAPRHVTRMSDSRLKDYTSAAERAQFGRKGEIIGTRWYAENTREPIRDETIREGLARSGAIVERTGVATTASTPRYALQKDFAALFDPSLTGKKLVDAIAEWQDEHLSAGALARVRALGRAAAGSGGRVTVTLPDGERRVMQAGDSSIITKAVIEEFAPRFLKNPAVVWISESKRKVIERDDDLARDIGINISVERELPDVILLDADRPPLLVFVEVVATDGAITEGRKKALLALAQTFKPEQVAFVTAYRARAASPFRKTVSELAWDSFAWLLAEPENLIILRNGTNGNGKLVDYCRKPRTK